MASLELDLDERLFDHESERQKLQEQMAQLSPRREATDGKFEVMTLPFYDEISPSTALERLFKWFHAAPSEAASATDEGTASAEECDLETAADGADVRSSEPVEKEKHPAISLEEFNSLRRCLGREELTLREWERALDELGVPKDNKTVRKGDFKALFGPPPFFGSEDVHGIVKYVMGAEERIHFAQILLGRFGVTKSGSEENATNKIIGLEEFKHIQVACFVDPIYGEAEWNEMLKKLAVPESQQHLDWKKFAECFSVAIRGKKAFGSYADPASVVYAVLANDKVQNALAESSDGFVSRSTITNLLKLKQSQVSDEKWMQLLEDVQTSYQYRKDERSATPVEHERERDNIPLVIVRNSRNQVLSYEITFADDSEVGLELQSDFYGHCLTVASIKGQAAKHPIVQVHDIVAKIDQTSLTYEDLAADSAEEQVRIARGMQLLAGKRTRTITFQRQESYFQYDQEQKTIQLFIKTLEDIPGNGRIQIKLPAGIPWSPTDYRAGNEAECLTVTFESPLHEDLDFATALWIPDTNTIEVKLDGNFVIGASKSVVMEISEIWGGDMKMVGPCEFGESMPDVQCVNLRRWKERESAFQGNPIRERERRQGDYYDQSLEPIERNFDPGDSGIELVGDFFGQCVVVKTVKKSSQAADRRIQPFDILTSISYVGDKNTLERVHCIMSLNPDKNATAHAKEISGILAKRHKSGGMYRLQFLRLNTHFYHESGRTSITLRALTTLTRGSVLVVRMPDSKWHVNDRLSAIAVDPVDVKIKEVFWDSQQRALHMRLGDSSVAESTQIVIEVQGISSGNEAMELCAGPGEVVGVHVGDGVTVPEMEIQFHDNWSLVSQETIETSKIVKTLKQFETSPAKLWEVLEYTSLLFDMYKPLGPSERISFKDLNRLVGIVCGDKKKMSEADWRALCVNLGAGPDVGLTRRQFACCWYDVVGLSSHKAKDTYIRLHTAERLFQELIAIYQDEDEEDKHTMSKDTIIRLAAFLKIPEGKTTKAIEKMKDLPGWDRNMFAQVVCGKHPIVSVQERDAMALWMKLFYSKKLFEAYSTKNLMRKKNMADLLEAAKIKTPKFTTELWSDVCDSVGVNDNGGLSLGNFLDVYAGDLLGPRHAVADWYRIETFKMLPERRAKGDASKEAVMSVAPEKVNVDDLAAEVLEKTASTEEILQDLVEKGLEFSKLEDVKDKVSGTFKFEASLRAKRKSRATGFLHIWVKSISELADHIIQRDPTFNADSVAEELYVMFQVTTAQGLKPRLPPQKPRGRFTRTMEALFGQTDLASVYEVREDEMWDQQRTQDLMREMEKAEKALKACKAHSAAYAQAAAKLRDIENQLTPPQPPPASLSSSEPSVPDWRVFSSLKTRDPSPDAIIRFPGDEFRVFVPPHKDSDQLYIVCKLFKRIGSKASRLNLEWCKAFDAVEKAHDAYKVLEDLVRQQEDHLRHVIAERRINYEDAQKDMRSEIWTSVAKLKQLRQDLAEFNVEVMALVAKRDELSAQLEDAIKERNAGTQRAQETADAPPPQPVNEQAKPSAANAPAKEVQGDMTTLQLEERQVKFIGQAFFELGELLNVLHSDKEKTDDLAVFRTETHNDVGVVLLRFKYKCASSQERSSAVDLSALKIKMAAEDVLEEEINGTALEYPSQSHLEINWKSDLLEHGDRLCLIREGTKYKVGMPYFFLVWSAMDEEGEPLSFKISDKDIKQSAKKVTYDWWMSDKLRELYSGDPVVATDPTLRSGNVHIPSSVDLSLPPGIYKLYLVRNETEKDTKSRTMLFRTVLGTSESLAVLPGVNGVHTSFGTTPLVDVKAMSASLQVFHESNRDAVAASLTNTEGYRDDGYLNRIALKQELAVARTDLEAMKAMVQLPTTKLKARKAMEDKIRQLETVIKELENKKLAVDHEATVPVAAPHHVSVKLDPDTSRPHAAISSSKTVVFAFTFYGDAPSSRDRIVVLPADVARVSDLLRATILGKLQANDPRQVEKARVAMEQELVEVEEFFSARMSLKTLKQVARRFIKPLLDVRNSRSGAAQKSDAYNAATGAMDDTFVWEECMEQFNACSSETKKCFPYIIRDLLDEIGARKRLLGLKQLTPSTSKSRLGKATSLLKCGVEVDIPDGSFTVKRNSAGRRVATGEVSTTLGNRFRQGGFYVAKYVRRAANEADEGTNTIALNESAGELCRYGPFYVERAAISFSFVQAALSLAKWVYRGVMSQQGKLLLKIIVQAHFAMLKYFLAVVSLSFNINVLAGNFNIKVWRLNELMDNFKSRLVKFYGPIEFVLSRIYTFFSGYVQELVGNLRVDHVAGDCVSGFFLYAVLAMIFAATFVVYIVVQEDLLRKVQKLPMYLPINPGKTLHGILEQIGSLLVIPLYLTIKSCVLFISGNWSEFYHHVHDGPSHTLSKLRLFTVPTPTCPNGSLARVNHGFGIAALVLIMFFLFICLPLLLLDLYSWVPLSELEKNDQLRKLAQSHKRLDIKAAVHSNASLVEFHPFRALRLKTVGCLSKLATCCKCCARDNAHGKCDAKSTCCSRQGARKPLLRGFARHYEDYVEMPLRELTKKYGIVGLLFMFIHVYAHLMLRSIGRALGIFLGWRLQAEYMYPNPVMKPVTKPKTRFRWKVFDVFCLRFNVVWKIQYVKDKMVMPFVNIVLVTLGLWGEPQWREFNVEERANDCYRMEPSGEIKQLQMMSLHGKIVSLFWLCIPETMVLAYLAEVLNRGPVLGYFLNRQFLQADIPESEREKDPVWRFHYWLAFKGEEDVVYLSDTRFYSTLLKWGSAIVEIVTLLMVYPPAAQNRVVLFGIMLISAVVTPLLELNQQMIQAYMDYMEAAENLAESSNYVNKALKAKDLADKAKGALEEMPDVDVNTRAIVGLMRRKNGAASTPAPAQGSPAAATNGAPQARSSTASKSSSVPAAVTAQPASAFSGGPQQSKIAAGGRAAVVTQLVESADGVLRVGGTGCHSGHSEVDRSDAEDADSDVEPTADPDEEEDDDDEEEEGRKQGGLSDTVLASLVASTELVKPTRELVQLTAMPEVSYVVLTNALDDGEGEITINWQVNARQRFHALDAIGMFPARANGDLSLRTMDDCICYRLLKHQTVEPFGWRPKGESEDAERELILRQARSLRDLRELEVTRMKKAVHEGAANDGDNDLVKARNKHHNRKLEEADSTMESILQSPKLKPYKKKLPDILEDDIVANKIHERVPRTSRAQSLGPVAREEAAKRTRKVVSGQVKFRPANNMVDEYKPTFETFVYGNDAGIYQPKYGLHGFEFYYMRCTEGDAKVTGLSNSKDDTKSGTNVKNQKVAPTGAPASEGAGSKGYEILEQFVSNPIQIGTFDIFMNLTCDRPLVGAKEKLNLSWIIYGVRYSVLSNPKMRNCIGFYKINGSEEATCARIEIIPSSAYLEASATGPCPGRMTVTTPNDPGVYEVRFLFNFFKKARLHRQCQVFGELEDEMQQLRIRSFYEKRAVTEELRKFSLREPKVWGIARMNAQAWIKAMLLSTIREPVDNAVLELTSSYSEFLIGHLKKKFQAGLESPSRMFQQRIAQILAPLRLNSFLDVLMVAFQSSTQLSDQLASVTFISPTEEDEKKRGSNKERDMLLLPSNSQLSLFGSASFRVLAMNYLRQRSLCGYHDFVDDILLNHGQLMQTLGQIMDNLSSSCIVLYESAITAAMEDTADVVKELKLTNALRGIDVMLVDQCRNHIQSMIRALLETDCRTGRKWPGRPEGSFEKLAALRAGSSVRQEGADPSVELVVDKDAAAVRPSLPGGAAPITREYVALRRWIRPKLERKIATILKQRHSRMMDSNFRIATQTLTQFVVSCTRPGLSLAGNPFPNHRRMRTESPLHFLEDSRMKDAKKLIEQGANQGGLLAATAGDLMPGDNQTGDDPSQALQGSSRDALEGNQHDDHAPDKDGGKDHDHDHDPDQDNDVDDDRGDILGDA